MHMNKDMQACVSLCGECATVCYDEAINHCLQAGGKHAEREHFALMLSCADVCKTAASVMIAGVPQHASVCAACADVCDACAASCDRVGDMEKCAETCRKCAESCREMSAMESKAA